ncbi:MAG TPA: VIT1/CCC1 transporter family protein [Vicinamibacterales bacterium]|nr:VIT1/CCC1 transporter family protein [Vicinamibacterales bacterium]
MTDARRSLHVRPNGLRETFRHYIRDLVYGANDGIITTFAVVAGVTGGNLSTRAVLVVGVANLVADGLSMGVGNYLGIRSEESARARENLPETEAEPACHGAATFAAFVVAGAIPLVSYIWPDPVVDRFWLACGLTFTSLFCIGALRSFVTTEGWLVNGLEMLGLGVVVAAAAYGSGALIAWLIVEP